MPLLSHLCCAIALMLTAALISPAQAHEMAGIEHVHLTEGIVHIVEPIPGVSSASPNEPSASKADTAPKPTQPSGVASLIVQVVLIGSVLVLMAVVLRVGFKLGSRQREQKPDSSSPPSAPTPPA